MSFPSMTTMRSNCSPFQSYSWFSIEREQRKELERTGPPLRQLSADGREVVEGRVGDDVCEKRLGD
jgi:hypothetical protein